MSKQNRKYKTKDTDAYTIKTDGIYHITINGSLFNHSQEAKAIMLQTKEDNGYKNFHMVWTFDNRFELSTTRYMHKNNKLRCRAKIKGIYTMSVTGVTERMTPPDIKTFEIYNG